MNRSFLTSVLFLVIVFGSACFPSSLFAATISVVPSSSQVTVGDIVSVRVRVDSSGTAINNGEGVLHFPNTVLNVASISKSPSIFTLWVNEPAYSASSGTISFNGGVPTPGFSGSNGTLFTVTFQAIRAGTATLTLTDGAVRANDGLGTDVLTSSVPAQLKIDEAPQSTVDTPKNTTTSSTTKTPDASPTQSVILASPTHPDQTIWYKETKPIVSIRPDSDDTEIEISISKTSKPSDWSIVSEPYDQVVLDQLQDGVWHLFARTKKGKVRGTPSEYLFHIDSTPAVFTGASLIFDTESGKLLIAASSTDQMSGVDKYQLTIDSNLKLSLAPKDVSPGPYAFSIGVSGVHNVQLKAVDKAGNETPLTSSFYVPESTDPFTHLLARFGFSGLIIALIVLAIGLLSLASFGIAVAAYRRFHIGHTVSHRGADRFRRDSNHHLATFRTELLHEIESLKKAKKKHGIDPEERDRIDILLHEVMTLEREVAEKIHTIEHLP